MKDIFVLPDCHIKPGIDMSHLEDIGNLIVDTKPDVVVQIGDHGDWSSFSHWDKGKKVFQGRRYSDDVAAVKEGMEIMLAPLRKCQNWLRQRKERLYQPRMVMTLGNHCFRLERAVDLDPVLEGTVTIKDAEYEKEGWEVYPFLEVVDIEGISFSHYQISGGMGRPIGSAKALIKQKHMSCVVGHWQHRDLAWEYRADGKLLTGLMVGTAYNHAEDYLTRQGQNHFRGVWILKDAHDGVFEAHPYTLDQLKRKYR
jgi:hypothetical protein